MWDFFLKLDLILTLHVLEPNPLLCIMYHGNNNGNQGYCGQRLR